MVCPVMKAASSEVRRARVPVRRFGALDRLLPSDHLEPAELSGLAVDRRVGPRQSGRDGVDRNSEISDFGSERPRKSDQAALACGVVGIEADSGMKCRRGNADNASPAALL